jgi:hypothetical protein
MASPPSTQSAEPFRCIYRCQRCRALLNLHLRKVEELSRAAIAMSRVAGKYRLDRFREAALEVRCIRQECRAIGEELRAHMAAHPGDLVASDPRNGDHAEQRR